MLLANCVRSVNKIAITKCVSQSMSTLVRPCGVLAGDSANRMQSCKGSIRNVTSNTVFTKYHQHNELWCSHRCYSSETDKGRKNDVDDDDLENWQRKLPRFDNDYVYKPSIYLMLKNALSTLLIRSYFDNQFCREEFINGAKQAVEVVSNLLAQRDFETLRDMVDDDTIAKMRTIVGSMTKEECKLISIREDDIRWIFPHEIQFITKENAIEGKSRFFVEIMVVIHAYSDTDVEFSELLGNPNIKFIDKLEKYYSIANYRFIKEFTKGVEDDWTINHILHVKPSDNFKEKEKLLKEL